MSPQHLNLPPVDRRPAWVVAVLAVAVACLPSPARAAVTLEQLVSRESPIFQPAQARLAIGRDGQVYLCNGSVGSSFVLRLSRDGKQKFGKVVGSAARNATANADAVVATANGHFAHLVALHRADLERTAAYDQFQAGDQVGWDAPGHVEAGASGDFYGLDQHRDRILRLSPAGTLVHAYPIPRDPKGPEGTVQEFRVSEKAKVFYLLTRSGMLRCVGFDGKLRWATSIGVTWGEPNAGGFDVDDDGRVYAIENRGDAVKRLSASGKPLPPIKLRMGVSRPGPSEHGFSDLRVYGNEVFLKRKHDAELFQRYEQASGKQLQVVHSDHERLTVTFPERIWTAGRDLPFTIRLNSASKTQAPRWRVWARRPNDVSYREFPLSAGRLRVPADCAGVYQIKVTPEVQPWQRGLPAEYRVRAWVEVRRPVSAGTASVFTPDNRVWYARGEEVPFSLLVRAPRAKGPVPIVLRLTEAGRVLAEGSVKAKPGVTQSFTLPKALTAALRPGRYSLTATATGLTGVPQSLVFGQGPARSGFHMVQYGDYAANYPSTDRASVWAAPELAAAHVSRTVKFGVNLAVDRLGDPTQLGNLTPGGRGHAERDELAKRLQDDPLAAAPAKASIPSALTQTLAGYSGSGVEQMAILMMNDAGLPLGGKGFDPRKPDQLTETLTGVTKTLLSYPAFRGWSWSSNWWIFERGASAARSPMEKAEYEAALQRARETGAWDPVLERVSGYRLGYAVEAQALFNKALQAAAPGRALVTASAAPYRNVEAYPPVTLANVDEVDLHAQWEQIAPPYTTPHGVDFYKRPGKRAWAHPEVWNDAGTGDQILTTLFQAVMRGADGVGFSGTVPPWGERPEDDRLAYAGTASVYRALGSVLRQYGPWLTTLRNHDRVAIVCSGRLFRIDEWGAGVMGRHFARVMEAYCSCLHAHHPASIVFAEDLKRDTLSRFKAILVVGQTVGMEPALADALQATRGAGARIFHDGTCRPGVVKGFTPLEVSFDKFEKDGHPASDDSAYWRFPAYCRANVPALAKALGAVTPPVAAVDNPEVFVSERQAEDGRYLFVVNNTTPRLEPGHLWRVSLAAASRVPVVAQVRLFPGQKVPAGRRFVYDILAGKQVEPKDGVVRADCRSVPARIFAVLPAAIAGVELRGPESVQAGQRFSWAVTVQDADGRPIKASIPVRIRLLDADGAVLEESFAAAGAKGAEGSLTALRNAPPGSQTLEATELFSGKAARLNLSVIPPAKPAVLGSGGDKPLRSGEDGGDKPRRSQGKEPAATFSPAEAGFGPHIRDMVLADNGTLAVMNTMNWDHNLYAVEVETGKVRWRQRLGHYFAFAPQPLSRGFAVQGFDFPSAEGYHLYLAGNDGKPERRFALYGLPKRLPHRFIPGILGDRINNFAVPPDGAWVASAGDLGLAVWKRDGTLLWSQDWWKTGRHTATLAALGPKTLLVLEGLQATAYEADSGKRLWGVALGSEAGGSQSGVTRHGEVRDVRLSQDGKTCALLSNTDGGRVYILKEGKFARAIPTAGNSLALSPDGTHLAVVAGNQLKLYALADGLRWVLPADDTLRFPRFAADGKRLAAASDLGTVYVVGLDGAVLLERDLGALAVPSWLPDGDLLLGTWMGTVCRLDGKYKERWRTHLQPEATDMRDRLLSRDRTPTTRMTSWGNAERGPARPGANLLSPTTVAVRVQSAQPNVQLTRDAAALVDGKPAAPPGPWLSWSDVGWFAELASPNYLVLDTFRTQLRVTGISFLEDPAHPESWLRDASLEYWDTGKQNWVFAQPLLCDAAAHTHKLAKPVDAARFRIGLPQGVVGNLRLAEVMLHGKKLGSSHPDVLARRPVAVLYDEGEDLKEGLVLESNGLTFRDSDASSGSRCLSLRADANIYPAFQPPFGHALPNWDFEIAARPAPGQYRYLQFAWKADKSAKGICLQVGQYGQQVTLFAGDYKPPDGGVSHKVADSPPVEWKAVRIDLWKLVGRPMRIQMLALGSVGGPVAFDQIILGRSEKDLPAGSAK